MSNIKLFESKQIRSVWKESEQKWYYVIADVVRVMTDTSNTKDYIKSMRKRDKQLSLNWRQIVIPLPMQTAGGIQPINCASAKDLMCIIQSISSGRSKPYKNLLALVVSNRLAEIEYPEFNLEVHKLKRYSDDRIEKRMTSIEIRKEFIFQWKNRLVKQQKEDSILSAAFSKAIIRLNQLEYKEKKGSSLQNFSDHMTNLELVFSMLGEASIKEIAINTEKKILGQRKKAAKAERKIAGDARKQLEIKSGKKEVTSEANLLPVAKKKVGRPKKEN